MRALKLPPTPQRPVTPEHSASDSARRLVDATLGELRTLIRAELEAAKAAQPPRPEPVFVNTKQAAEIVGVHAKVIEREARRGWLAPIALRVGSRWRFERAALIRLMQERGNG